ncbi:619_t:CDS:10, partial [Dentiscutata heterogama]
VKKPALLSLKTMFETIEDNEEIIRASIKLIWKATNGKVVNITFDDPMLLAKVVLDNDTSKIIILDEPEAVLLNKNNYRKIRNKLAEKSSIAIYKEEIDDGIQANANIIESDVAKTDQQTEKLQINKCFKVSKKNQDQSYNAIEKDQGNENQVLNPNFQKQSTGNSQLNTSEITIEESAAQSSSFDIEEDNAIKGSNLSNDTGASISVEQTLNYEKNSDPSNANKKNQENRAQVLKSKVQVNYNDSIERILSDLTDNSLPSISEILPSLMRNNSYSKKTALSQFNNVENDVDSNRNGISEKEIQSDLGIHGADIGVRSMSSISSHNKPDGVNENEELSDLTECEECNNINNTTSVNYPIVLITDPPPTISLNNDKQELVHSKKCRISLDTLYNKESKYLKRKRVQYTSSKSDSNETTPEAISYQENDDDNEFIEKYQELQLTTIKKDKVWLLKNTFESIQHCQFETYGDKLFFKSNLIEKLLTENLDHLFKPDEDVIHFSLQPLPFYSQSFELLDNCIKEWNRHYKMIKSLKDLLLRLIVAFVTDYEQKEKRNPPLRTLRVLVSNKIKSILQIDERHERRYWNATWQLIELLNLMQCPALILVKSGVNSSFLKKAFNNDYDKFLKKLLNDEEAYHKTPKFDNSLMKKIKEKLEL